MAYLDWKDEFSVGIEEMDSQHKRWIEIINELHDAMKSGQTVKVLSSVLRKMTDYIVVHFKAEEALLEKNKFPDLDIHRKIHEKYALEIHSLVEQFVKGKVLISIEIMDSLKKWLTNHIKMSDREYGIFITGKK
jgi:hemerythrin